MLYHDSQGRLCGFLNLEEKEGNGRFVRRYFLIDSEQEKFLYYHDNPNNLHEDDRNPIGEINFAFISKVSEGSQKQRHKKDSCFVVNYAGKTLYLQAENDEDMKAWIQALNDASKITVPKNTAKQISEQETGFKTEIAGGVVCKIPIRKPSDNDTNESSTSSESEDTEDETPACNLEALKSGYCVKQGGIIKNWKRRYFVVNDTGILYFNSEQSKDPLRHIPKNDITGVRAAQTSNVSRDNLFEVLTAKRTFYVQCDTPEEVQEWIVNIQRMLENTERSQSQRSGSKENKEMDFPVTKVFPQSDWV